MILVLFLATGLSSCQDEPELPPEKHRLILIYAVAANNLQPNLGFDMKEIIDSASKLNLQNNKVLVYSVVNSAKCTLQELQKRRDGSFGFVTVQEFPDLPLSTSKERISEVMEYVNLNYPYPKKGLILWSHADGWLPWDQSTPSDDDSDKRKSFGWDSYEGAVYKTNITDLAEAIPDNTFDFIWFDCCYMANIETVYQLKDKTDYIVGSVLEIASDGMPYQLTMPLLLQTTPDLKAAALEFFTYYDRRGTPVSVSITKTSELENLAEVSKEIFAVGTPPASLADIQTYQRNLSVKFYDMGQLLRSYTDIDSGIEDSLNEAFQEVIIYKLISDRDFNSRPIQIREYSGLSMHNFVSSGSSNEEFYKELAWYKATRKQTPAR